MWNRSQITSACAALAAVLAATATSAHAHQIVQNFAQNEQRAPDGRILVEGSIVSVINCDGPGERGGQFYIYMYVYRPGFRAILPPNWGAPIGGRDFATFDEAAGAACRAGVPPPVASGGSLTGQWGSYTFVQIGNTFTWRIGSEIGEGTIVGDDLQVRWTGGGTATGKVTRRNAQGDPTQLTWSNSVVMSR